MSKALYSCAPDDPIETAERIMRSKQIRRIPVLNSERRLMGILSLADIAKYFQRASARGAVRQVISDEVASTLADICQRSSASAEVRASL
jgi:CBS-domain-containing membrane protein